MKQYRITILDGEDRQLDCVKDILIERSSDLSYHVTQAIASFVGNWIKKIEVEFREHR